MKGVIMVEHKKMEWTCGLTWVGEPVISRRRAFPTSLNAMACSVFNVNSLIMSSSRSSLITSAGASTLEGRASGALPDGEDEDDDDALEVSAGAAAAASWI